MSEQLPLTFPHRPQFREVDFLPSSGNREAMDFLGRVAEWPGGRLALWGEAGAGKTHLLRIWAARTGAAVMDGAELQQERWPAGPLALDGADAVPNEVALLHLLNAAEQAGHPVLLAARPPPARYPVRLPDLASRLRAILAVQVGPADEAFLADLLSRLLSERQMVVSASMRAWLLRRLPRRPGSVVEAVARLDGAALAAGSGITRALAAEVLGETFAV